jgi:hypothetical protein
VHVLRRHHIIGTTISFSGNEGNLWNSSFCESK